MSGTTVVVHMHYHVTIHGVETVSQLEQSWSNDDFRALLKAFDFEDADEVGDAELWEYLTLAIREVKPEEAAEIVLEYRCGDDLSKGQIEQIAHDMLVDKVAEEYPDIALHQRLFACNQLLFKAYNGKFPKTLASIIDCTIAPMKGKPPHPVDAEIAIKALGLGLNGHAVITRLLGDQLSGKVAFPNAEHIVWQLESVGDNRFKVTTSDYWLSDDDFASAEFDAKVVEFVEEED